MLFIREDDDMDDNEWDRAAGVAVVDEDDCARDEESLRSVSSTTCRSLRIAESTSASWDSVDGADGVNVGGPS